MRVDSGPAFFGATSTGPNVTSRGKTEGQAAAAAQRVDGAGTERGQPPIGVTTVGYQRATWPALIAFSVAGKGVFPSFLGL